MGAFVVKQSILITKVATALSESQITGDNTKNCRAVRQLTMDGIPIQDFHSVKAAARTLGISASGIHEAAQGFRYNKSPAYSAGGYKWEYV